MEVNATTEETLNPPALGSEAKVAARNAGWLMAQRGAHGVASVAFAVLVPRLMGPETFGRYALITSVSLWFAMVSGMSSAQIMARFIPEFAANEGNESIQKFFGNLLVVRLGNGLAASGFYFLLSALWFRDLDAAAIALVAGSVLFKSMNRLVFALFLGLNRAARWGIGDMLGRWLSLVLLIPGFYYGGLRGACLALLLAELVVLGVGVRLARPFISWSQLRLDARYIAPYLRFSAYFFAANMLLTVSQRSGELLVRVVSGDYVQVGLFGVAHRTYLTATQAIWSFSIAFVPLITMMLTQRREDELRKWIERLLKWTTAGGVLVVYAVWLLGDDLLPLALGKAYGRVGSILLPLTVSLVMFGPISIARLLSLAYDRPRVAVIAAAIQLTSLWGFGWLLVSRGGAWAASVAVLVSSVLYASFFTWTIRRVLAYSLRNWGICVLLGGLFAPLAYLRSGLSLNIALYIGFVVSYCGSLVLLGVVTPGELSAMRRAIRDGIAAFKIFVVSLSYGCHTYR